MSWWTAAVQVARRMFTPVHFDAPAAYAFDSTPKPIADLLSDLSNVSGGRISRVNALSVSAVQRGRNEICSLATLPLRLYRGLDVVDSPLLRQPDPDVPNVKFWADLIEDLCFEGVAWCRITSQDFGQFPMSLRRVDPWKVSPDPPKGERPPAGGPWVWVDGERVPMSLMIRFDSPNPAVLTANARAIRTAMMLEQLSAVYASNPRPLDYFTDTDDPNVEPFSDEQAQSFIARWAASARRSSTAWMPSQVKRVDVNAPSPAELQLVEIKRQAWIEIANGIGVDPEDVGVSTTSRTYQNEDARRRDKINRMFKPYMCAITDRLSMGDVTRRGYSVGYELTDYLAADPATQITYWRGLLDMGVTDATEIRGWAKLPGPAPTAAALPAAAPVPALDAARPPIRLGDITPGSAAALHRPRFADDNAPAFTFDRVDFAEDDDPPAAPEADESKREITGLAVPYGKIGRKFGIAYRFAAGSIEYDGNVKHYKDHYTPVGMMTRATSGKDGLTVTLSVLGGPEGSPAKLERDQLLFDAKEGLYNGLSIGVDFDLETDATFHEGDRVWDVHRATLREVTTTAMPAFNDARVTKVAASRSGGNMEPCPHCGHRHAPGIACATFAQRAGFTTQPTPNPAPTTPTPPGNPSPPPAPQGADPQLWAAFSAFQQHQQTIGALPTAAQAAGALDLRTAVNGNHGPAEVREPSPYRFDRKGNLLKGSHDFLSDLIAGWEKGDVAARDRAQSFTREAFADGSALAAEAAQQAGPGAQFAVTSGNVAALNPNRNRPDLYVDQMEYTYPMWEAINKGTLEDITPFVVPKFNTATGLVNNHVEGTEPTPGAFTATAQTITPGAVSGKVEYTREAWDQGGNPQASGLIWRQMTRGYYEALEARAAAFFAAQAASIADITITTAAVDSALDQALSGAIVPLNFIRGGNRFRTAYTQIDLFKAMAAAKDSAGRRLYPEIGPQNANGTVDAGYRAIYAHGVTWLPAWALAATGTVAASSWMFDPDGVAGWATAPERIDITWRVAWVDIGIWGYAATALLDGNKAREVIYDPV